jgi:large subunit ribosomal protein L5
MSNRFKQLYQDTAVPKLREQFNYQNIHEVPKIVKVTINRGLGETAQNAKALEASLNEVAIIAGQRPVVTRAKKAIAGFKIRKGMPVGIMVTLRRDRMYAFLDRLINLSLPRIRDFRGISPKRAAYFPRSKLRQRGSSPWDGRFHHHHSQNRRGRARPAEGARNAIP